MTVDFFDGVESNDFSVWTGTETANGGTIATESNNPHHGTYNGICTSDADADTERGRCYYDISETEVYARCYFKMTDVSTSGKQLNTIYIAKETGGQQLLVSCGFYNNSGQKQWVMYVYGDSARYVVVNDDTIAADTWYCGEVHFKKGASSNAEFHLYINGVEKIAITGETSNYTAERVMFGMCVASGSWATTMYFDCCKIANVYIGPETGEVDLSANFTLQNEDQTELSANVTIQNESQDELSANATIQNKTYTEFSANVTVQNESYVELSGNFTVQNEGYYEVSGNVTIQNESQNDLSVNVTVQNKSTADLSSNVTIQNESYAELSANFTIATDHGYITLADAQIHSIPLSWQTHTIEVSNSVHQIELSAATHTIEISTQTHTITVSSEPLT